jgi:hypothetical protein
LVLLLLQWNKSPRKLNPGVLHAGLTALVAGIVLVGLHNNVKPDEELNHIKVGIKFIFLLIILVLGYTNVKKPELPKNVWLTMLGLTITNIVIASWRSNVTMTFLYRCFVIILATIFSVLPAQAALAPESIPAAFDELLKNQSLANPAMIVIDGNTGAIVYEKNADSQRKPASVMKILTGAVMLEHLDPLSTFATTVTIDPEIKTVVVRGSYDPWISLDHNTARKMNRASLPYIGFRTMSYVKEFNGGSLKNYKVLYSGLYSQDVKNLKAFWAKRNF